jgi:hypothetical protein
MYDPKVHNDSHPATVFTMMGGTVVSQVAHESFPNSVYPGQPIQQGTLRPEKFTVPNGSGIWSTYFEPVSDFVPGDKSCRAKPLLEMRERLQRLMRLAL